ncbi:MAG: hypothetical protein E7296_10480 [Lachnospiraceae bacterium]|jgi:hypothetical protein|nr:hypothetical protein [Lachnospiraceae bacterium]
MKILIIGNGYDLNMGLNTSYPNFLDVLKTANEIAIDWNDSKASLRGYITRKFTDETKVAAYLNFSNKIGKDYEREFRKIAKESFWVFHFMEERDEIGDKWLDFEEEIRRVIDKLASDKNDAKGNNKGLISIGTLDRWTSNKPLLKGATYKEYFKTLQDDLNILIRALEIYMDAYINQLETPMINMLSNKEYDKLLSFNYTSTYVNNSEILYRVNPAEDICYIHGKADVDRQDDKRKMVLGFDDHYMKDATTILEKVPFEKYYQRIVNKTDNNYMKWFDEIKQQAEAGITSSVTLFGHSLTPSDGDILKEFIINENVQTEIYYLDDDDRARKVQNLAYILGPDKLIELSGPEPRIRWLKIEDGFTMERHV